MTMVVGNPGIMICGMEIWFNHSLGLDFSDPAKMNNVRVRMAQMAAFRNFVELALEWRKPLILHVRMATVEAIQVMSEVRIRYICYVYIYLIYQKIMQSQAGLPFFWPIHLHCFNEGWETCQKWMQTYPNMKFGFVLPCLDDVVTRIPLDRLLLETDAPYFPARLALRPVSTNFTF